VESGTVGSGSGRSDTQNGAGGGVTERIEVHNPAAGGVVATVDVDSPERVAEAATVLLPGSPLSHPDHDWLARVLAGALAGRLALYAEQPYTRRAGTAPAPPRWLEDVLGPHPFVPARAGLRDRLAKWRAIRCYGSQLPLLAMRRSVRRGPASLALAPEAVAWVGDRGPV